MKLELATFPVEDVRFSSHTRYTGGVLEIDKEELLALILEDKRVSSAAIDVAFPGDQTRIVNVRDVVEPRVKVAGSGCVFPGVLGPVEHVGEGRTHRLSGVTVTVSAEYKPTILSGTAAQNSSILDMWGPAAKVTPFGSTINVVPIIRLIDDVTELEAHAAIQSVEFKLARRLAETVIDASTEDVESFELSDVDPALPRVVYIDSVMTNWQAPHSLVAYYGLPIRESLPALIHPNEFFDGVLTSDARIGSSGNTYTWGWMNPPVVLDLLRAHGKRLNFLGVILQRTRFETEHGKQVTATCAAQMAKLLKAEGAIITRTVPSGANFVDVMLTVQACEKRNVKTVFLTPEWGGKDGADLPLVFYVPEATAMVSTGSTDREFELQAPTKVIGVGEEGLVQLYSGARPFSPWSELTVDNNTIAGACDWWGESHDARIAW
jgi:glycine reductase complex component B subunit alpha and beta